jgi:hypothetical protein
MNYSNFKLKFLIPFLLILSACVGAATDIGPVSLPTPFSGLVASSPSDGFSTITGAAGSVSPGEQVNVNFVMRQQSMRSGIQASIASDLTVQLPPFSCTADSHGFFTCPIQGQIGDLFLVSTPHQILDTVEIVPKLIDLGCEAAYISLSTASGYFLVTCKKTNPDGLDTTDNPNLADDRGMVLTIRPSCAPQIGRTTDCCDYSTLNDISSCIVDRFVLPQNPTTIGAQEVRGANGVSLCQPPPVQDFLDDPQSILTSKESSLAIILDEDNGCENSATSANLGGVLFTQISPDGHVLPVTYSDGHLAFVESANPVTGGRFDGENNMAIFGSDWSKWEESLRHLDHDPGDLFCSLMSKTELVPNPQNPSDHPVFLTQCQDVVFDTSGALTIEMGRAADYIPGPQLSDGTPSLNRAVQIIQYSNGAYLYVWDATNVFLGKPEPQTLVGPPVFLNSCNQEVIDLVAYDVDAVQRTANLVWTDGAVGSSSICTVKVDLDQGTLLSPIQTLQVPGERPWRLVLVRKSSVDGGDLPLSLASLQSESEIRAYYALRGSNKVGCVDLSSTMGQESVCTTTCGTGAEPTHLYFDTETGEIWVVNKGHHTLQIMNANSCK